MALWVVVAEEKLRLADGQSSAPHLRIKRHLPVLDVVVISPPQTSHLCLCQSMKPTQPLLRRIRRLALTTKQVNGGYYKGTGSGSMGSHTKHGGYVIDQNKVRTYVVPPDLDQFKVCRFGFGEIEADNTGDAQLTPFVTKNMEPLKGTFKRTRGPFSGEKYIENWRAHGYL